MGSKRKDERELRRLASDFGGQLLQTRNSHYGICLPNGEVVYCPSSPSDWRFRKNLLAQVRRAAGGRSKTTREAGTHRAAN